MKGRGYERLNFQGFDASLEIVDGFPFLCRKSFALSSFALFLIKVPRKERFIKKIFHVE